MREIPKRNYLFLVVLLLVTVVLTLVLSNIYVNKDKLVSNFYEYSNKIKPGDFEQYVLEYSDFMIYVSDKYDLSHEVFEKSFENKINDLNLKEVLVFIDKNDIDKEFLSKLKNEYNINIDLEKTPILIVIIDKKVIKSVSITPDSNIDTIIEYEVFE